MQVSSMFLQWWDYDITREDEGNGTREGADMLIPVSTHVNITVHTYGTQ